MSKIEFYIKYIFRTEKGKYNNWRFYFPLLGVAFGVIAVTLTFAIMQGMENEIFKKLTAINFTSRINDENFVKPENEMFLYSINKKAIVSNGSNYRIVNVRAIEDFNEFKYNLLSQFLINTTVDTSGVILGKGMASKLGVKVGDFIELMSPMNVNLFTGIPNSIRIKVSNIFNLQLLNYDDQYIFTDLSTGEELFNSIDKQIYSRFTASQIKLEYPNVQHITSWEDEHIDFIAAMNLEKVAFSSFGFLIILLSAFSSFSIMCVTVIRRMPEIGILRTLGFSKNMITRIYFLQSFLIGLIGGFVGVVMSKIFIKLDVSHNLIKEIFSSEVMFDYRLTILNSEIFIIYLIGLIIMLFAGVYPSIYASRIPINKSLNYNK